jgi:sialate O-acetylesterase
MHAAGSTGANWKGPMMKSFVRILVCVACVNAFALISRADVKVPAIFGDHMVLQRGMKIPVWGTADAGEKVTVNVAGQTQSATADENGKWRVTLDPIDSKNPVELTISGKNTITIHDALVGEVWLCSGQSNMSFPVKRASNGESAVKEANHPQIRLFTVVRVLPDQPLDTMDGKWEICSPETVPDFAAVGYFFGLQIHDALHTPVGLIDSSWGGTRAEAWLPRPTFDALHLPYEPQWTEQWLHPKQRAGSTRPAKQRPQEAPSILYNGMIHPFVGFAMRGVVWYQGETNTAYGEYYDKVLSALIKSWRDAWNEGDFPFLVVQLANLQVKDRFWPITREAQAKVARELPNVGLAVTIDIGNPDNIHPTDKLTVAKRLTACAMKIAYHKDVPDSGPTFKSLDEKDHKVVVHFDHTFGGLVSKTNDVEGFELAGADKKFVPAQAEIKGDTVVVSTEGVSDPKTIRYAFENDPKCSLFNKADLPAVPFEARIK